MLKIKVKEKKPTFKKRRDNYARKLRTDKLIEYLQSELTSSTTHGLPYIVNTRIHWFERVFWAISFVFANAIIFVLLSSQYTRYMENPIVMSVEMDYFNWNASYPAVILCPTNKADEEALSTLVNDTLEKTGLDIEPYLRTILLASLDTLQQLEMPQAELLSLIQPKDFARICLELFKRFDNSTLTTITNWPLTVDESMTEMGMCHIINSNVAIFDNPSKWSDSDVTYAKNNIELSFHDRDFFVQIMNYADEYEIYVHSPDDILLSGSPSLKFDTEGFLSFGVQISSTRASKDLRFMSLHLRKCRFIEESNSYRYPVYSYNRCMLECRIKMILKMCGCIPHFYKPLDQEKICDLAQLRCVLFHKREIMTLSASKETMEKFKDMESIPRISRDCGCLSDCEADVYLRDHEVMLPQETINRLKISVSSFPKVRIVRDIIISFYDIICKYTPARINIVSRFLASLNINLMKSVNMIAIESLRKLRYRVPCRYRNVAEYAANAREYKTLGNQGLQ